MASKCIHMWHKEITWEVRGEEIWEGCVNLSFCKNMTTLLILERTFEHELVILIAAGSILNPVQTSIKLWLRNSL